MILIDFFFRKPIQLHSTWFSFHRFNEQMVGDSYNLNFFRDSVDPELYGEGRYHASHHAHHGHHKKHHKNNHHSKHPHHHKTTTQPHDEDLEADNILTGNPLTTPTDNTKSEDKIKTDEIVPKPEKDVEIKREEAEEGNEKNIGDTMGNESTVGQVKFYIFLIIREISFHLD